MLYCLKLVGAVGFELTTLCSQSRCATRLRYAPKKRAFYRLHPARSIVRRDYSDKKAAMFLFMEIIAQLLAVRRYF